MRILVLGKELWDHVFFLLGLYGRLDPLLLLILSLFLGSLLLSLSLLLELFGCQLLLLVVWEFPNVLIQFGLAVRDILLVEGLALHEFLHLFFCLVEVVFFFVDQPSLIFLQIFNALGETLVDFFEFDEFLLAGLDGSIQIVVFVQFLLEGLQLFLFHVGFLKLGEFFRFLQLPLTLGFQSLVFLLESDGL